MKKVNIKLEWHIEKRKVSELKIWEENPRSITKEGFEKLKDRIIKRGFHDVIKIDIDNTILSGNMRKRALVELEVKNVDCIVPNRKLTPEEMQEVAIESNRTDGTWNWDMLANFEEATLNEAGFESGELDQIFGLDVAEEFNTEEELNNYLKEKGQKLLDTNEVIIYGNQGKSYWDKKKGTKWAGINDHITWSAQTAKSGGQNIVFGTKPLQILVPYIKILSPRDGIVMEPFAGSFSTGIACEIMHRKCRAIERSPTYGEVCISRWERFTGKEAKKIA